MRQHVFLEYRELRLAAAFEERRREVEIGYDPLGDMGGHVVPDAVGQKHDLRGAGGTREDLGGDPRHIIGAIFVAPTYQNALPVVGLILQMTVLYLSRVVSGAQIGRKQRMCAV